VVAFHAFPDVVRGGFIGVDVFFVISGYLISGNILSGIRSDTFTLGDFYVRRARRILPSLVVALAGTLAIGWTLLLPIDARYSKCWLSAAAPFESYGAECRTGETVIWGDSHAARLYTGFRDGCRPSLNDGRQTACDISNAAVINEITRLEPKRVIIFAAWLNHPVNWQLREERVQSIRRAIRQLKEVVDDVILLGPAPFWTPDLPTAVFRFWIENKVCRTGCSRRQCAIMMSMRFWPPLPKSRVRDSFPYSTVYAMKPGA